MWLIISSLSSQNLHLLFCCRLSVFDLIRLVLIALFCASIWKNSLLLFSHVLVVSYHHHHHHHHVMPQAQISLTLSRHFFLSFIASGRSSGPHPVSSHSCWMYVRTGHLAFARPYVGVHRSTTLMSSSLLLQQCPACLVRLTWIVFVMGGSGHIVGALWGVTARSCSILLTAFLCNCHLASCPAV